MDVLAYALAKNNSKQGPQGEAGLAATIAIGSTTTGEAGTDAAVSNSGTESAAVLDFTIPRGAQGVQGETGPQGDTGPQGPQGEKGDTGETTLTPAATDALMQLQLDGANTTAVFNAWWPLSDADGQTRYSRLERFFKMLASYAKDKTYTLRFYNAETSGDDTGTPLDDLADGREAAPLVTDADSNVTDWAENDPFTWYIRANALSLADGTMDVLAVEGMDEDFDLTGETAPVYCFALGYCMKEYEDTSYLYTSYRTTQGDGYEPLAEGIAPDSTRRYMVWHPAFGGSLNASGGLTSGAGTKPALWVSAQDGITKARITSAYEGLWTDCDQQYVLSQWRLRHWTLANSGHAEGCTSYNVQNTLAVAEENVKRVLVTAAQGANYIVGSAVELGERGENTSTDRNQSYNYSVFKWAKILSKETVTVDGTDYTALNLDIEDAITTTTTMFLSTMPWENGTTEALQGHSDGSIGSLTNGKYPIRVAGIEMLTGAYIEELDPLWNASIVNEKWHYDVYTCRDSEKQANSTANYTKVGEFDLPSTANYAWHYIKALGKLIGEAIIPTKFGGSSSTYLRAAFYSTGWAGVHAPWRGGLLSNGGHAGLACAGGYNSPASSSWNGFPRLAGVGKKRGESAAA